MSTGIAFFPSGVNIPECNNVLTDTADLFVWQFLTPDCGY
jgi:hypothetical protein